MDFWRQWPLSVLPSRAAARPLLVDAGGAEDVGDLGVVAWHLVWARVEDVVALDDESAAKAEDTLRDPVDGKLGSGI